MKQKSMFIVAAVAFVAIFVGGAAWYNTSKAGANETIPEAMLSALNRSYAPSVGPADAPVVIVEFLDPACETCATFYPLVKDMMAANPGRIRVVLRWAPFHDGSPNVVALLEAARKQGKFWPALETLLASQPAWTVNHTADATLAWVQLGGLGLNSEQLFADMASPDVAQIIAQDIQDANTLNVTATPEFFVNGKPLPSWGYEQLKQLVDEELAQTSR
ncbi:MAG: thioredoxin domain-containing protein [Gemmatimonadetes bacterium]|jgi:protein-disulfide isomerase|nr:thioredoxin domain-containing protein [Gemmatimonadota bacterium]